VPAELDARIEGTKHAMRLAYALGARVVLNHVGRIPGDAQSAQWKLLVEVLDDLGRHGLRTGATLAVEAGAENPADLGRLLAALPAGSLGIDLNPGDLILHGFSATEAAQSLGASLLAVHLTDAVREATRAGGELVLPGQGQVDFPSLLGILEEQGYRGHFTLAGLSPSHAAQEVAQTMQFLRRL
jgi:sugar phosphate isomerase/epimerase